MIKALAVIVLIYVALFAFALGSMVLVFSGESRHRGKLWYRILSTPPIILCGVLWFPISLLIELRGAIRFAYLDSLGSAVLYHQRLWRGEYINVQRRRR